MDAEYAAREELFLLDLSLKPLMILATAEGTHVTARSMSVVTIGTCLYFQTDRTMLKAQQIRANPRVALCVDAYQIEGRAEEFGRWQDHPDILAVYRKSHAGSYLKYESVENERVYRVKITRIQKWEYVSGQPWIRVLDLENRTYRAQEFPLTEVRGAPMS